VEKTFLLPNHSCLLLGVPPPLFCVQLSVVAPQLSIVIVYDIERYILTSMTGTEFAIFGK